MQARMTTAAGWLVALLTIGCGGEKLEDVTGKVTVLDPRTGKSGPLAKGAVVFHAVDSGRTYRGAVADGAYTAKVGAGKMKLTVLVEHEKEQPDVDTLPPGPLKSLLVLCEQYADVDSTPLAFEVKAGVNTFDIHLGPAKK